MSHFALGIVLVSALLHAGWSVAIKGSRDPLAFNLLQTLPPAAVGCALLASTGTGDLPDGLWRWIALTGVAHALYMYWMSRALQSTDLSLVYPIARSTPAFLPLLAVPLLGEQISLGGGLGIATVVVGMWLLHAGRGLRLRVLLERGTVYAYLTLAATVAYSLFDKSAMVELESAEWARVIPRSVFYFFALEASYGLFFVPLALWGGRSGGLRAVLRCEWGRALGAAVVSFASYGLILEAMRTAPASYVVAVRQISVLFTVLLSAVLLGEQPGRARILGATLTVAGVALVAVSK
jgi:drug/metabolite transporter (DMT)-like permease